MAEKETNDLLRFIAGQLSSLAGGIPNLLRNGPQLLSSLAPEPLRPMVGGLIQSGLGYGLNTLTGTANADIRMSDLLWSTSNQAMRTGLERRFQRTIFEQNIQDQIVAPIANDLRSTVLGNIYGANAGLVQGSGWSKALGAALQSDVENFLSDTISPALAEGVRFNGPLSISSYRNVAATVASGYFSNQYAGMTAADVGAVVADRAKFDSQFGTSEGVRQLHEDLRYIAQSVSNIKDIVGEDVTVQQVQQALTAITGSDLTRTSPQTAAAITNQLSYLNRRFGVTADDWAASTKLMTGIFGEGNITKPLAAALGLGMAETAARTRSNNMFVSDQDLRIAQGIDIAQQEGMGVTNNLAAANLVLEQALGKQFGAAYQQILSSGADLTNLDEVARQVSRVSGLGVGEARRRLSMFTETDSALLAERKVQIADDAAYLATRSAINRGKVFASMFRESVGANLYTKVLGNITDDQLRQMSQADIEKAINSAVTSGTISADEGKQLIGKASLMVAAAGGSVQWANINAARELSPEQRALYNQAIKRTSQGTLSARIAAFMKGADENTRKLFEAYINADSGEAKTKAFQDLMTKGGAGIGQLASAIFGQKFSSTDKIDKTVLRDAIDTGLRERKSDEEKAAKRAESQEDGAKATKKGVDDSDQIKKLVDGVSYLVSCFSNNPILVAAMKGAGS